jgi:hypothetical protein
MYKYNKYKKGQMYYTGIVIWIFLLLYLHI